jgi:hypothetical protein
MDTVTAAKQHEPLPEPLTEVAARALAREILRCPGWVAYAARQPFWRCGSTHAWWVRAHHLHMRLGDALPITSREEWVFARMRWIS